MNCNTLILRTSITAIVASLLFQGCGMLGASSQAAVENATATPVVTSGYNDVPASPDPSPAPMGSSLVQVSMSEYNSLIAEWESSHSTGTWGGRIGKTELQNVINSLDNSATNVTFHFASVDGKTSVIFMGGSNNQGSKGSYSVRNSGSESWCPTICPMQSSKANVSAVVTESELKTLNDAYESANSGKTYGGIIARGKLQDIINSAGSYTNINWRFCTENGKTSVIFIGGTEGQSGGSILMYRNTGSGINP